MSGMPHSGPPSPRASAASARRAASWAASRRSTNGLRCAIASARSAMASSASTADSSRLRSSAASSTAPSSQISMASTFVARRRYRNGGNSNPAARVCRDHSGSVTAAAGRLPDMTASQIQPDSLLAARERWVARGVSAPAIVAVSADGAHVEGADGVRYLDFAGGIGCQNLGHNPQAVVRAIHEQVDQYLHQCFMVAAYEPYVDVCRKLGELSPCRGADQKSILFNSGAEAVENAVKIARAATGRPAIVSFDRGFHGRTLMTMTLTSKVKPYKKGFGPFAPEVYRAPAPYPYRGISLRRQHRRARAAVPRARRSGDRRRGDPRARAGRGRLHRDARGLPREAARAVRPPRHPVDRRRGPVRRRPHRAGVGDRALRRAAGPARVRQVAGRRAAAGGRHRAGRR